MRNKHFRRDSDGIVYNFEEVIDFFELLVTASISTVSIMYYPNSKHLTIVTAKNSYSFTEI